MAKDDDMLEELRRIRTALETKPAPAVPAPPKGIWAEFIDFLSKYKVLGLAVAFILATYLGELVKAMVKDLLMPVIGLAIPGLNDLATYTYMVNSQQFGIGEFVVALITFVIVAFVIFILVKITKKWGIQ